MNTRSSSPRTRDGTSTTAWTTSRRLRSLAGENRSQEQLRMRNRFHLLGCKCSVWERDVVYRPARTPGCPVLRVCCLPPVLNPVLSGQVTCKIKTVEIQNSRDSTCTHRLRRSWSDSDGVARHHTPSRGMIPPPTPALLSAFHIKKKIQKVESTVALKTTRFSDQNAWIHLQLQLHFLFFMHESTSNSSSSFCFSYQEKNTESGVDGSTQNDAIVPVS